MKAFVAYKTQLDVNNKQASQINMFCGGARFAYNWGLAKRIELYEKEKKSTNFFLQNREINALKKTAFPWMYEGYSKCVFQESLRDLDKAFANFFRGIKTGKKVGFPRFKSKRNEKHSFRLSGSIHVGSNYVKLPRLGKLKLHERNYIPEDGKIFSATVSKKAGRYFVSIQMEVDVPEVINTGDQVVGIDLGIKSLASCSNGMVFENPRVYKKHLSKLKRLRRSHSRKKKGSHNKEKSGQVLANLHYKISNIRRDNIHKMTTALTKNKSIGAIVLEDLSAKNMMKNRRLAQSIADSSFGEIKRQFDYKCKRENKRLVFVDRWYPSSKTCSACGHVKDELGLGIRTYVCEKCGLSIDRDYNACLNIAKQGTVSLTGTATVKSGNASGEGRLQPKGSGLRRRKNLT